MSSYKDETEIWYIGRVIGVPSGDTLRLAAPKQNLDKTVSLSSIRAPKLGGTRGGVDEAYAWESREFLRKLLIGEDVVFKVDFVSGRNREFCSVFLSDVNVACLMVCMGLAKVKRQVRDTSYLAQLHRLQMEAKQQRLGEWSQLSSSRESVTSNNNMSPIDILAKYKGRPCKALVEHVKDGSTIKAYLLPDFHFIQMLVAGVEAPCSGRMEFASLVNVGVAEGDSPSATLTPAQKYAAVMPPPPEMTSEEFGREARFFVEKCILHRDVCIVVEGADGFGNLVGSVYYTEGDASRSLAMELIINGLARYADSGASLLDDDARRRLKEAEIKAKKNHIKIWTTFVLPHNYTKPIQGQDFKGTVVEVVSGDFIIVADDSSPYGCLSAERRVHLSSLKCPKIGPLPRDESPASYAYIAKEYLRSLLIGRKVYVSLEFTKKVDLFDEDDSRMMDFGSVFLYPSEGDHGIDIPRFATFQLVGPNVAELVISKGFGVPVRHLDFDERSHYYESLVRAEKRAVEAKRGIHSGRDPPIVHNADLVMAPANEAREFFSYLRGIRTHAAIVEHVFTGHRLKLLIPKEACSIAFSFSAVRCPGRGERFSDEAVALTRRLILQRDVEVMVQAVDSRGTFLGMLWEGNTNVAVALLEAGLARIQAEYADDGMVDVRLARAERLAKEKKLRIWENYSELEDGSNVLGDGKKLKEVMKVLVTEVKGGGKFYVQEIGDHRVATIMEKMASLSFKKALMLDYTFIPKKGDVVVAQFSKDKTWNRALIVNGPKRLESSKDRYEVFYIDYGNREVVNYRSLHPLDRSLSSLPGVAQLCRLAYIKVPQLDEEFGEEAATYFSECVLSNEKVFSAQIEGRDNSGEGSETSTRIVTLVDEETNMTVNAAMLEAGLARLERKRKWDSQERKVKLEEWKRFEEEAKARRLNIWEMGDFDWDDEHSSRPYENDE